MNLTTATPAEIDAEWAPLSAETASISNFIFEIEAAVRQVEYYGQHAKYNVRRLAEKADRLGGLRDQLAEARKAEAPYVAEWTRRGGWTRAYLVVTNGQGHVHRSTSCSTCYATTQFSWLIELSGADEQTIVDAAGERACTVCYASAPVELRLDRPTTLFSEDEKRKQAERDERLAKRAERDAKRLLHPVTGEVLRSIENNYRTGELRQGGEIGKTERGATNAAVSGLNSYLFYGADHPSAEGWIATADLVAQALVAKNGGEYAAVREDLNERGRKSHKRETGRVSDHQLPEVHA